MFVCFAPWLSEWQTAFYIILLLNLCYWDVPQTFTFFLCKFSVQIRNTILINFSAHFYRSLARKIYMQMANNLFDHHNAMTGIHSQKYLHAGNVVKKLMCSKLILLENSVRWMRHRLIACICIWCLCHCNVHHYFCIILCWLSFSGQCVAAIGNIRLQHFSWIHTHAMIFTNAQQSSVVNCSVFIQLSIAML